MAKNLYNKETNTPNAYIQSDGQIIERQGSYVTDYIESLPEGFYMSDRGYLQGSINHYESVALYDHSKKFLQIIRFDNSFVPQSNVGWIRVNVAESAIDTLSIVSIDEIQLEYQGPKGKSAYEGAVEHGYQGTEEDFYQTLALLQPIDEDLDEILS